MPSSGDAVSRNLFANKKIRIVETNMLMRLSKLPQLTFWWGNCRDQSSYDLFGSIDHLPLALAALRLSFFRMEALEVMRTGQKQREMVIRMKAQHDIKETGSRRKEGMEGEEEKCSHG